MFFEIASSNVEDEESWVGCVRFVGRYGNFFGLGEKVGEPRERSEKVQISFKRGADER